MEYQVFLNFIADEDTHGFTSNLYDALERAAIHTFRGHPLWHTIHRCLIAIIVFSYDYASSPRCLLELQEIMKCHETQAQLVLPIFYDVDRSDVLDQSGIYGEAMEEHEQDGIWSHLVLPWRQALMEAANLLIGFDEAKFGPESMLIRKIVVRVRVAVAAYDYDVFLSYKTEDNHGFTSDLYRTLVQRDISTFAEEDEEQPSWVPIKRSRIAIIVFSKHYASSTRRLDELLNIMECHRTQAQVVMPIFYNVSLSDVRRQSGSYGKAMIRHEESLGRDNDRVLQWRQALTAAVDFYTTKRDGFVKVSYYE